MAKPTRTNAGLARTLIRHAAVSTVHQALVFDAIDRLENPVAEAWQRLFARHADVLALGAEAPDHDFRDFKNHLLFPAAGFWGGAPARVQCWYRNLVTALQKQEWQNASYCAGVLSHYLSDAVHPFHTAQSQADNDASAALDRVTLLVYRGLAADTAAAASVPAPVVSSASYLDAALRAGATAARADYDVLVGGFDVRRSLTDPATGLDAAGHAAMARYVQRATLLIAAAIDAAIAEAAVEAPPVSLLSSATQAIAAWPITVFINRQHRKLTTRVVQAMAAEQAATGRVEATLPAAVRVKRDLYARHVLSSMPQDGTRVQNGGNVVAFPPARASLPRESDADGEGDAEIIDLRRQRRAVEQARPAPRAIAAEPTRSRADMMRKIEQETAAAAQPATPVAAVPAVRA